MSNLSIDLNHNGHAARSPLDMDASLSVSHEHTDSGLGADQDYAYSSERSNDSKTTKYIPGMTSVFNRLPVAQLTAHHNSSQKTHYPCIKSSGSNSFTGVLNGGIMKPPPKSILGKSSMDEPVVSAFDHHHKHFPSRHHHKNVHPYSLALSSSMKHHRYATNPSMNPIHIVEANNLFSGSYPRPNCSGKSSFPQSSGLCSSSLSSVCSSTGTVNKSNQPMDMAKSPSPNMRRRRSWVLAATESAINNRNNNTKSEECLINGSAGDRGDGEGLSKRNGTLIRLGFSQAYAGDTLKNCPQTTPKPSDVLIDCDRDVGQGAARRPTNYNNPHQILNSNVNRSHNSTSAHCYSGHNNATDNTLVYTTTPTPSRSQSSSTPPSSLKLILTPIIKSSKR